MSAGQPLAAGSGHHHYHSTTEHLLMMMMMMVMIEPSHHDDVFDQDFSKNPPHGSIWWSSLVRRFYGL